MSIGHLYVLFGEMSIQVFYSFLRGLFVLMLLSIIICVQILDTNPLSDITNSTSLYPDCNSLILMPPLFIDLKLTYLLPTALCSACSQEVLNKHSL